jgi:hypothetical protein
MEAICDGEASQIFDTLFECFEAGLGPVDRCWLSPNSAPTVGTRCCASALSGYVAAE